MNKVTLSLVALATLGGTAQVQAADLTPEEQKAEAIKAKKAAIDEVRIVLNAASVSIQSDCPDVKDEFLLKLSKLTQELNDKYNDDKITEFDEAMKASYIGQIQEIKSQAVAKHALLKTKGELDSAYKTLKDEYDKAIAETGKYPNVGPGIKAELQKLNVEQVQKDIEAAYATGKIDQSTQKQIEGNMNTLTENIAKLIKDIEQAEKDYNDNEASYKAVIAVFDAAKAEYDTQLQEVIKALPTPTYENWQNAVVKELNAQYRLLLDAKKKVEAAYAAGTAATQSTDLKAIIASAESKIITLVGNKKAEAQVEDVAKAKADAQVKDLQTKLNDEKAKLAKYNLTDCDAAIAAVQKQIDDMQTDINAHYANGQNNVSKQDYVAMEGKINTAIGSIKSDDKYKKTVDEVVANKEAQLAMDSEVETLEKALTTAIEKAKTASADKAYNAAAYFEASVKAINDNINKAKTAISGKFGTKEAAAYKASADYAQLVKTIKDGTTAYGTRTDASLVAYNKAAKAATDAQALLDKLVEKAKDTTVKVDATTTYADKIASIKKDIKAINDAIATAKAKKDDAHRTAMESAASKTITEDIAKLTTDYDAHKLTFDKDNADKSAKAYIKSAQDLINAETVVLGKIGDPAKPEFDEKYGNQKDNIRTEFTKLQTELDNLTAKKTKAETDYNADMAAAGADETKLLNAAAKAIGVLADVNKELDALKTKVEALDKVAEGAADNVVAYKETIKEVNSTSAAKTTLDNYRAGLSITVDPAWTYYDNAMSDYILQLAKVADKVEAAYAAHTSRADKKSLLAEKDLVLANAKALTEKVKPNQDAYTAQSKTVDAVKKEWQEAYDKVSNGDLSNQGPEFLSQLTKQQETINKLAETAETEFGKGAAVANNNAFNDSVTNIRAKLNEITGKSQSEYAKNVNDQNSDQHDAFLSAFNLSSTAFSKSVNELNQFRTIQREDLRENALVTNELVTVHKNIYAYADKLRKLQEDELAKYNGFVAMDKKYGADDVFFDSKSYTDAANLYKSDIEKLLKAYEDKVNAYAESLITADLAYAQSQLSAGKSAIAAFTYAGKDQAFDDLATLISKVTTSKNNGGTFAVQVDKQWLGDLAKANVDKMYNADVAAACTAEKATLVDAVTKIYNAEKDAIGKLADIDAKKYLADLDVLKSNTIDKGVKENPTLAAIPTIKSNCEAYIGTILAKHSDVYANAVQASKDIAANNTAYAEITKNLEAADAVLAAAYKKLTQLYSLHVKNDATDALRSIELAYYAQVADAKKYNEEQSCVAHKDEFKDLAKVYQTMVDGMKGNLIDFEISDVRTKIVQVKEEYNLAVAAVGLDNDDLKKCDVEELSKSLDAIKVNWKLPTSDKNKKSYDEIMKLLLDQEVTVADMYQTLNGMYDNKKEKVTAATSEIDNLKADVETKLAEAENMAAYNETLTGKYKGLVEHLRTKFNSTTASYEAKQKAGQILFFKDNFMFDFGVVQESLDKTNGRVAALKADYTKFHENDVAFETLKNGIDELNTQLTGFQEHIKDFVSLTEKEKTDEVSRLSTTISTMLSEITTAHDKIALPDASFTDDVAYVKGNILTIQTSWTNSEVPARLSAVKKELEAALSSMTGKRYSPSTLTELNNSYAAIDKLLTAASEYNDDAVDGTIVKDIDGEVLKKAEVVDYLKVAWPLMVERINKLAADTKSFAERTVEASYIKGDARHDNNVDVNDYTYVRNWILADKTFKDVVAEFGEGAAYGGDVDESGDFTVADLARISNIIFYGNEAGPAATRARATRSVETDQITVAKQSEETTVFGKTVQLAINVTNNATFTAGQFDVTLPAGMKLVGQELTDRGNGHEILGSELSEGKYRILASTVENSAFAGHDGALVVLNVEVGSDYAGGNIEVSNAIFSDAEGRAYVITRGIGGGTGDTTGIDSITAPTMKERIYSIGGMVKKTVQKGINIIVGEDGTARKVVKK